MLNVVVVDRLVDVERVVLNVVVKVVVVLCDVLNVVVVDRDVLNVVVVECAVE